MKSGPWIRLKKDGSLVSGATICTKFIRAWRLLNACLPLKSDTICSSLYRPWSTITFCVENWWTAIVIYSKQFYRTILALGYHITMDKPPSRIRTIRLPNDPFAQSNGYKPAPLDLSQITLTNKLEELVDQLAENTHNVWAKERISQGWTYGLNEVRFHKFSPSNDQFLTTFL